MKQRDTKRATWALNMRSFDVDSETAGQRLDNFLLARHRKVPKSHLYKLVRRGAIRLNQRKAKPHTRLAQGDRITCPTLHMPPPHTAQPKPCHVDVLFEDDALLVINKPAGLAVHAGSGLPYGLIESLRLRDSASHWELAHRLDRDTSGCLMIAKTRAVQIALQAAWASVQKTYMIWVHGTWPASLQRVDTRLTGFKSVAGERRIRVSPQGLEAVTHYRVVAHTPRATWLQAELITGRTHQIRVHCAHAGYPIVGDSKYGKRALDQQWPVRVPGLCLHAVSLRWQHPVTHALHSVEAPLPTWWEWRERGGQKDPP